MGLSFPRAMEITFKNCGGRNVAKKNGTAWQEQQTHHWNIATNPMKTQTKSEQ